MYNPHRNRRWGWGIAMALLVIVLLGWALSTGYYADAQESPVVVTEGFVPADAPAAAVEEVADGSASVVTDNLGVTLPWGDWLVAILDLLGGILWTAILGLITLAL